MRAEGRLTADVSTPDLSSDEQETIALVRDLLGTGNLHPLIAQLRGGDLGPERARDALRTLADYDVELLVQLSLDALVSEHVPDRAARATG